MDDQEMFDRQLHWIWVVIGYLFKILIYTPIFFAAFMIAYSFIGPKETILLFLVALLVSLLLYFLVYFLKGMLIALKYHRNLFWILLFLICVAFTCVLPVYIVFDPVGRLLRSLSKSKAEQPLLTWIFSLAFGIFVYYRYDFLRNVAPRFALPAYELGVQVATTIVKGVSRIRPNKSRDAF